LHRLGRLPQVGPMGSHQHTRYSCRHSVSTLTFPFLWLGVLVGCSLSVYTHCNLPTSLSCVSSFHRRSYPSNHYPPQLGTYSCAQTRAPAVPGPTLHLKPTTQGCCGATSTAPTQLQCVAPAGEAALAGPWASITACIPPSSSCCARSLPTGIATHSTTTYHDLAHTA
jgi:hypothetical protein